MFALYKLQAKAWLSNPFSKMDFITTALFLIVLGSITSSKFVKLGFGQAEIDYANIMIISSITILMIMNGALFSFGFAFFDMKESILFKRIGATKISKTTVIGSFILWGSTMILMTLTWIFIIVLIFNLIPGTDLLSVSPETWASMNWGGVFTAVIITTISFLPIALLFVSFSSNSEIYNIFVTFYFFTFAFLGGSLTPQADAGWMTWVGYFSPLGWTTSLMGNSMLGFNVFDVSTSLDANANVAFIFGSGESNLWSGSSSVVLGVGVFVFPIIFGASAAAMTGKTLKWD